MAKNQNLNSAAKAKKDKFYTQLEDVAEELRHYQDFFKGKIVLCNCDDPFESNFFQYFAIMFNALELKKLIATSYADSPIKGKEINLFPDGKTAYMVEVDALKDWNGDGREDLDDVKFAIEHGIYKTTQLEGDLHYCAGDFRSEECLELLKQADVVVTNPPFSVFREFVATLMDYRKKFLILGNKNAITYKEIFPLIMQDKFWIGFMPMSRDILFEIPEAYQKEFIAKADEGSKYRIVDGKILARASAIWFTNIEVARFREDIPLYKKYSPEEYPRYDNYDAIEVSKTAEIPCDYFGVMGVPITFLDKYDPRQFEILGMCENLDLYGLKTRTYTAKECRDRYFELFGKPGTYDLNAAGVINGKKVYQRILIRRRQ